jgi:hypothetical protein
MKYLRIVFISSLIFLIATSNIYSQSRFGVHLGTAIPLSSGFYKVNEYSSDPTIGINAGMEYSYRFPDKGIGVFTAIDFMYNGISKDYKEEVEKYELPLMGATPEYHEYYNIPFSTGVHYAYRLNDNLVLSSNAGLTVNCLIITDLDLGLYKFSTEPAFSIGGRVGVGLIINNRVSINLDYLGLGSHTLNVTTIEEPIHIEDEWSEDFSVHMLTLTAAIYFYTYDE